MIDEKSFIVPCDNYKGIAYYNYRSYNNEAIAILSVSINGCAGIDIHIALGFTSGKFFLQSFDYRSLCKGDKLEFKVQNGTIDSISFEEISTQENLKRGEIRK